jgi:hypothetical protein
MDKRVADVIWTTARERDTPDVVVEAVLGSLLPSIRLVAQQPKAGEEGRVGGCRIGDVPDLPQGVEWPRPSTEARSDADPVAPPGAPLSFLLQVNLAEVAFADREQLLPKAGMLYFFFHLDEGGVGEADVATVLFAQGTKLRRTMAPLDLPPDQLYQGFNLVSQLEWTVPSPGDLGLTDHFELWDELEDRVAAVQGYESPTTYGPGYAVHRLLGHAQFIQAFGTGEGERLLLQLSSDAGLSKYGYPESGIGKT